MDRTVVLKYGGNAMTDQQIKETLIEHICLLKQKNLNIVIVHGGGPFIKQSLEEARIESEFIDGQRKTSVRALERVEMTLKGKVNGNLVNLINKHGATAVGLSGKDGKLVIAEKRYHTRTTGGTTETMDLGQVGNVRQVNTKLLRLLLKHDYLPVITCIASDEQGNDYNINGDIFAGHIAAAMEADEFIVLTDVDGLMRNIDDPDSVLSRISFDEIDTLIAGGIIRGGMIPKIEACKTSLEHGARRARIINGTKPAQLLEILENKQTGTLITKSS